MNEYNIAFESEGISFVLPNANSIASWLKSVIELEKHILSALTYIFCDDDYLHQINVEHLNHDNYTDVITFQYADNSVDGDVFMSVDRIRENATQYAVAEQNELHRVMVHGLLHLMGYKDKTTDDKVLMTEKENCYLSLLKQNFKLN